MLNQLPLALQSTAVIKNSLQACFSVVLLANEGARALRKYKVGWKTFIKKWCYFIFVPPYLFAPSLFIKKREEKICEKSLVTSPLPLVTHCPDLSLSLWWCLWRGPLYDPRCDSSDALSRIFTCLMEKKNILSFPMHSILQPLGLFWEGFVQIDYWFVGMQ